MAELESVGGKLYSNGEEVTTPSYLTAEPGDWIEYPDRVPGTIYTNDTEHILDVRVILKSQATSSTSYHYFDMGGQQAPGSRYVSNIDTAQYSTTGGLVKPGGEMRVQYDENNWGLSNPEIVHWSERIWI